MLCACARGVGAEVKKTYAELIEAVEKPASECEETTLEQAQTAWEMTLEESRRAVEGGDQP